MAAKRRKRKRVERVPYVSLYPTLRGAVRSMERAGINVNRQQLGTFLHDRKVERELSRVAMQIGREAGRGYVVDVHSGSAGKRARAAVIGHTYEAIRGERKDKRLANTLAGKGKRSSAPPKVKPKSEG